MLMLYLMAGAVIGLLSMFLVETHVKRHSRKFSHSEMALAATLLTLLGCAMATGVIDLIGGP